MAALQMTRPRVNLLLVVAAAVLLLSGAFPASAAAQTVVVANANDSGPGSLREALAAVNAGTATAIDMTGLAGNITLVTPLPVITNPVTINGAGPALTIDGTALGEVLLDAGAAVTFDAASIVDLTKDGAWHPDDHRCERARRRRDGQRRHPCARRRRVRTRVSGRRCRRAGHAAGRSDPRRHPARRRQCHRPSDAHADARRRGRFRLHCQRRHLGHGRSARDRRGGRGVRTRAEFRPGHVHRHDTRER